jgi:toxin ParE1/3/4
MPRVLRTSLAEQSFLEAWLHIAGDNLAAADRWQAAVESKCLSYAHQPEMGDARPDLASGVRCFPVSNYVVFYRPIEDGIQVLLVIHGARDIPHVFRDRLKGD